MNAVGIEMLLNYLIANGYSNIEQECRKHYLINSFSRQKLKAGFQNTPGARMGADRKHERPPLALMILSALSIPGGSMTFGSLPDVTMYRGEATRPFSTDLLS